MKRTQAIELPQEEIAKQKEWMAEFAALEDRPRTYCVVTYGCQMNAHDSETLEGMLAEMGMTPPPREKKRISLSSIPVVFAIMPNAARLAMWFGSQNLKRRARN